MAQTCRWLCQSHDSRRHDGTIFMPTCRRADVYSDSECRREALSCAHSGMTFHAHQLPNRLFRVSLPGHAGADEHEVRASLGQSLDILAVLDAAFRDDGTLWR